MYRDEVFSLIGEKGNRSIVVGIDGLGGSGKTTFATSLANYFREKGVETIVFHIDDFIHPKRIRYDAAKEEWFCYYFLQWRYDYFIFEVLSQLVSGDEIHKEIELYDKEDDVYAKQSVYIPKQTVVIIEGVFLQRPELKPFFDYVVYMDVPQNVRLKRVLKRDTYIGDEQAILEKYKKRYFPAEEYYMRCCSPVERADHVIIG